MRLLSTLTFCFLIASHPAVFAHDFKAGSIQIDHPYATPTYGESKTGAVYFRAIKNNGSSVDHLIAARSPVAEVVEIHRVSMDDAVMRMRQMPELEIRPGQALAVRHDAHHGYHLMLIGLKKPLKEGDRFPLFMRFKQGGEVEVNVVIQRPKSSGAGPHEHKH